MLAHHNIDRTDASYNTKAPFDWRCPLMLLDNEVPINSFRSIKIYLKEDIQPPVRLYKITEDGDVDFHDAFGTYIGTWRIFETTASAVSTYINGFVLDTNGVIVGHVEANKNIPNMFISLARKNGGYIYTENDDFKLLPQCHVASLTGTCKTFVINGTYTHADSCIGAGIRIQALHDSSGAHQISVVNTIDVNQGNPNYLCKLQVGGGTVSWIGNRHILLRHKVASNLRVCPGTSGVILKGVSDD